MQSVDLSKYAPEFKLYINNNEELGNILTKSTISVSVKEEVNQVATFTIVVADHFDVIKQEFTWLDSDVLKPGNIIRIEFGYNKNKLTEIIEGQIATISTSGFSGDIPKLTMNGFQKGHKELTEESSRDTPIKIEKDDTYSRIAEKLADSIGLKQEIDDTTLYSPISMKKPTVYNQFLKDKAKRVGYEFFVTRNTLYFINPRNLKRIVKNMVFEWGTNIIRFVPSINTSELVTQIQVRGHTSDSKRHIVVDIEDGREDVVETGKRTASQIAKEIHKEKKKDIKDQILNSEQEGRDMGLAELNSIGDRLITGEISIVGNPNLMPGQIIEIKRVGRTFSGKYFVTQATHTIDGNGYTTTFNVRRNVM